MSEMIRKRKNGLGFLNLHFVSKEIGLIKENYSLKELLDQITLENLHKEIHTGERIGNEEW